MDDRRKTQTRGKRKLDEECSSTWIKTEDDFADDGDNRSDTPHKTPPSKISKEIAKKYDLKDCYIKIEFIDPGYLIKTDNEEIEEVDHVHIDQSPDKPASPSTRLNTAKEIFLLNNQIELVDLEEESDSIEVIDLEEDERSDNEPDLEGQPSLQEEPDSVDESTSENESNLEEQPNMEIEPNIPEKEKSLIEPNIAEKENSLEDQPNLPEEQVSEPDILDKEPIPEKEAIAEIEPIPEENVSSSAEDKLSETDTPKGTFRAAAISLVAKALAAITYTKMKEVKKPKDRSKKERSMEECLEILQSDQFLSTKHSSTMGDTLVALSRLVKCHNLTHDSAQEISMFLEAVVPKTVDIDLVFEAIRVRPHFGSTLRVICLGCRQKVMLKQACGQCRKQWGKLKVAYHLENDLEGALRYLFEHSQLARLLEQRESGREQGRILQDAIDGGRYSAFPKSSCYDLSFIQTMSSRSDNGTTLRQTFLTIAEVDPELRKDFILLESTQVLFAEQQHQQTESFCVSMQKLSTSGVTWTHPGNGKCITSKAFLLCLAVDPEMRNSLIKIVPPKPKQPDFVCSFCEAEGSMRFFSFQETKRPQPRTHWSVSSHAYNRITKEKWDKSSQFRGVEGLSTLFQVPHFDVVQGFAPDYTSDLFGPKKHVEVATKLILRQILAQGEVKTLAKVHAMVNERLSSIEVQWPYETERVLTLEGTLSSKQWRNWLLFLSLPVLQEILSDDHLQIHCLLVRAVFDLLKDEVAKEEVEECHALISKYLDEGQTLYGKKFADLNVHHLLHYPENVLQCGPLWSYSTFVFEEAESIFEKVQTSSIAKGTSLSGSLQDCVAAFNSHTALQIACSGKKDKIHLFGEVTDPDKADPEAANFLSKIPGFHQGQVHGKALVNGVVYLSKVCRDKQVSSFIHWYDGDKSCVGEILCFCKNRQGVQIFVAKTVQMLAPVFGHHKFEVTVDHIRSFKHTETLTWGKVQQIQRPLIRVGQFLCIPPNMLEVRLKV